MQWSLVYVIDKNQCISNPILVHPKFDRKQERNGGIGRSLDSM